LNRALNVIEVVAIGLLTGLIVNIFDVTITVVFAVKDWELVLKSQGIDPSPWTPPYYVSVTFLGGIIWVAVYNVFQRALPPSAFTAFIVSLLIWSVSRLYGGGHVVMRQMPLHIFAIMSSGLLLGYVVGGQVARLLIEKRLRTLGAK
jgi:hypothetical protein